MYIYIHIYIYIYILLNNPSKRVLQDQNAFPASTLCIHSLCSFHSFYFLHLSERVSPPPHSRSKRSFITLAQQARHAQRIFFSYLYFVLFLFYFFLFIRAGLSAAALAQQARHAQRFFRRPEGKCWHWSCQWRVGV